jgi:hypothetical protein
MKPGEGLPLPGVHVLRAVREWAVMKMCADFVRKNWPTSILGDLLIDTMSVQFESEEGSQYISLVVDADTASGGHFHHELPWDPAGAMTTLLQVVQQAGGVVHA